MLSRSWVRLLHTVVPRHRPCSNLLIGILGVEVGLLPNTKEDFLGKHVGCRKGLACVEDGDGGSGLDSGHGEGRLQAVLVHIVGPDDVVIPLVELLLVRPCDMSAIRSMSLRRCTQETPSGKHKLLDRSVRGTYTTFGMSALFVIQIQGNGSTYPEVCCKVG